MLLETLLYEKQGNKKKNTMAKCSEDSHVSVQTLVVSVADSVVQSTSQMENMLMY